MMRNPQSETEQFIKRLFGWGMTWLIIGLFFEPYQGGIKKDPATFSYYFLTAGLARFSSHCIFDCDRYLEKRKMVFHPGCQRSESHDCLCGLGESDFAFNEH